MNKHWISTLCIGAAAVVASVLSSNLLLYASEQGGSAQIQVMATIMPERLVIVDQDLMIIQIYSNTADDVRPTVLLNGQDGKEMPYSESIESQYQALKPVIDFSKSGQVYKRDDRPIQAFIKKLLSFLAKITHSSL